METISESKLPAEFKWICEKCLEGSGAHTCAWRGIDGELCPELSQLLKNWKQLSAKVADLKAENKRRKAAKDETKQIDR